ncbi:MAG: hypothetical protein HZB67_01000 [Candidatus Aenigmarchaeota archaeon]|nr:hypothetical protein [Candidatus Aenigmarchaeota archaeon]
MAENYFLQSTRIETENRREIITIVSLHPDAKFYDINHKKFRTYSQRVNGNSEIPGEWLLAGSIKIAALDNNGRYVNYSIEPLSKE